MENISKFTDCYGCSVCAISCTKNAIQMQLNNDGFYTPSVDDSKCIECQICLDVCAFNDCNAKQDTEFHTSSYAAWSKDSNTRQTCTSGGVSFEIGRFLLQKGYHVIGCRYNPQKHLA